MQKQTAFIWGEKCFWHYGGNYALLAPVGGWVQPMVSGGLPEAPETKRRLKNLIDVSGLSAVYKTTCGSVECFVKYVLEGKVDRL